MRRYSILRLMGCVLLVAVGLAALRDANDVWASVLPMLVLGLLGAAVLGVVQGRGRERAWWLGFALFGGVYHLLASAPWVADVTRPTLPTTRLLDFVHSKVAAPQTFTFVSWVNQVNSAVPPGSPGTINVMLNDGGLQAVGRVSAPSAQLAASTGASWNNINWSVPQSLNTTATGGRWKALLPGAANYEPFLKVGHALFAATAGLIGAFVSCRFHARRERAESVEAV